MTQSNTMKPAFRAMKDTEQTPTVERVSAELVVDTADRPLREGVRRRETESRHLLFCGPGHFVDVSLTASPGDRASSLIGQIGFTDEPARSADSTAIRIVSKSGRPVTTRSNGHGEFSVDVKLDATTRLLVHLGGRRQTEIRLGEAVMRKL